MTDVVSVIENGLAGEKLTTSRKKQTTHHPMPWKNEEGATKNNIIFHMDILIISTKYQKIINY